jgi:DNA-directed RNA polymerase subunit RPC12/RpoP/anti-anti-sigma regulatory factor
MLKVVREKKNHTVHLRLSGTIDEHMDLPREIGPLPEKVVIVCREISQINSLGAKAWVEFFGAAAKAGLNFCFAECPPPMVEQLNYITNFACGGLVVSVSVPFNCEECGREFRGVVKSDDLKQVAYKLPPIKCPKCQARASFDDVPEEYFAFLIRQG